MTRKRRSTFSVPMNDESSMNDTTKEFKCVLCSYTTENQETFLAHVKFHSPVDNKKEVLPSLDERRQENEKFLPVKKRKLDFNYSTNYNLQESPTVTKSDAEFVTDAVHADLKIKKEIQEEDDLKKHPNDGNSSTENYPVIRIKLELPVPVQSNLSVPKQLACTKCDFTTEKRLEFMNHFKREHIDQGSVVTSDSWKCDRCQCTFTDEAAYTSHTRSCKENSIDCTQVKESSVSFACSFCDYKTTYAGRFRNHLKKKHSNRSTVNPLSEKPSSKVQTTNESKEGISLPQISNSRWPRQCRNCKDYMATDFRDLGDHLNSCLKVQEDTTQDGYQTESNEFEKKPSEPGHSYHIDHSFNFVQDDFAQVVEVQCSKCTFLAPNFKELALHYVNCRGDDRSTLESSVDITTNDPSPSISRQNSEIDDVKMTEISEKLDLETPSSQRSMKDSSCEDSTPSNDATTSETVNATEGQKCSEYISESEQLPPPEVDAEMPAHGDAASDANEVNLTVAEMNQDHTLTDHETSGTVEAVVPEKDELVPTGPEEATQSVEDLNSPNSLDLVNKPFTSPPETDVTEAPVTDSATKMDKSKRVRCSQCPFRCKKMSDMARHYKLHGGEDKQRDETDSSQKNETGVEGDSTIIVTKTLESLSSSDKVHPEHRDVVERTDDEVPAEAKPVPARTVECRVCYQQFNKMWELAQHFQSHNTLVQ